MEDSELFDQAVKEQAAGFKLKAQYYYTKILTKYPDSSFAKEAKKNLDILHRKDHLNHFFEWVIYLGMAIAIYYFIKDISAQSFENEGVVNSLALAAIYFGGYAIVFIMPILSLVTANNSDSISGFEYFVGFPIPIRILLSIISLSFYYFVFFI